MVAFLNSPLAIVLACIVGMLPAVVVWGVMAWLFRRDRRRWEVREQLRDMEQAIREEVMPEEQREWWRHYRERQAAIRCEARRRLGLPEEEPRG
jgi:uncharacterized membrane protein YccC